MKLKVFFPIILMVISLLACNNKPVNNQEALSIQSDMKSYTPIEGNWELVSNEVVGHKINLSQHQQFKLFNKGFFCFIMNDSLGNFHSAGAGPYEINGNTYKETVSYYSDPKNVGTSDWQEWEMKGDTLIFYGFKKVTLADGTDVTKEWEDHKFIEKRIRAKK